MIDGLVNVYKEKGYTSHDVVAVMRGIFGQKRIGHTGTLDPDATGVLPILLGSATKLSDMMPDDTKTYRATLLLGVETNTQDITGEVISKKDVNVSEAVVRETISSFVGTISQLPPMYSAIKVNGKKLVDLAREGIVVERKKRDIQIFDIKIEDISLPEVVMTVDCSKGTYIRTLCHDIGEKLGTHGCMKDLVRTRAGCFHIGQALKIEQIQSLKDGGELSRIVTRTDMPLEIYGAVFCKSIADKLCANGNKIPRDMLDIDRNSDGRKAMHTASKCPDEHYLRLYDSTGRFVGLYANDKKGMLKPIKIF